MWQHTILGVKCLTVNTHGTSVSVGCVIFCRLTRACVLCLAWELLLGVPSARPAYTLTSVTRLSGCSSLHSPGHGPLPHVVVCI